VTIVTKSFIQLLDAVGKAQGVDNLRYAVYPGTVDFDTEDTLKEKLEKSLVNDIVIGLTQESAQKSTSVSPPVSDPRDIIFKGSIEEVNRFYFKREWTDGLPIIPPTPQMVEEFLKYTDLTDHEIAVLPQARLKATPWNIAVNGVMAGCRPQDMPLLISAVEAMADPAYNLEQIGTTAGINPFLLVNGPAIKKLGIEYGVGLISCGPNPAIGRFLGLVLRNIAGFKPAFTRMGTFGYVLPFVLAEDEEAIREMGWEPYHVDHGFSPDISTVTAMGSYNWGFQEFPKAAANKTDVDTIVLPILLKELSREVYPSFALSFGERNIAALLLTPPLAQNIARAGYSKKGLAEWLWKNMLITVREQNSEIQRMIGASFSVHSKVQAGEAPAWFDKDLDEQIPVLTSPDVIHIIVCGDKTRNKTMALYVSYPKPTMKEIKLTGKSR
jgi:hypothetical protein